MAPNTGLVYRLAHLQGSDSLVLRSYWELFGPPSPTLWFDRLRSGASLWPSLLHVRYLLTPVDLSTPGWRLVFQDRHLKVYANERAYPFAWFVPHARRASWEEIRRRAWREVWRPAEEVWLPGEPSPLASPSPPTEGASSLSPRGWKVEAFAPNRVRLRGEAPQDGWLVVGEAYAPGWRAVVRGEMRRVERADFFLRAVPLRAGEREVVLLYAPTAFRLGGFLAGWGWVWLVGGAVAHLRRRRRRG
jgi:uncharacterized membrane protein YfhO